MIKINTVKITVLLNIRNWSTKTPNEIQMIVNLFALQNMYTIPTQKKSPSLNRMVPFVPSQI